MTRRWIVTVGRVCVVLALLMSCGRGGDQDSVPDGSSVHYGAQSVCGRATIKGTAIGTVPGPGVCGVTNAVRVEAVRGVTLSQPAVLGCSTAQALDDWVRDVAQPAMAGLGGGLSELHVAAHYVCRRHNHKPGAKVSEHGKGRAIDLSAFRLRDGSEVTVLNDWGKGRRGKALASMHAGACGRFGTVLGPKSDRHHRDHFHFDTAQHRGGAYCR